MAGAARKCPHCEEIIFLAMDPVPEAYLVPLDGESPGERIALAARMVIGRSHDCEINVLDNTLSRQHAEICLDNGEFVINDLDSRNRVIVNGTTVAEAKLAHGDEIRLGSRTFRFELIGIKSLPAAWKPEERTRLGDEGEVGESGSTVRISPADSASLLARLRAHEQQREAALLAAREVAVHSAASPAALAGAALLAACAPEPAPIRVLEDPPTRELAPRVPDARRTHVTVLCADVYGLHELAQTREPRQAVEAINACLSLIVHIAQKHGASVDVITGDSIRAFWVAPVEPAIDAKRAVACALDVHAQLAEHNLASGLPPVTAAIGIHNGDALAGPVGVDGKLEFAVMGETVTMAGRLRAYARPGEILITRPTNALLGDAVAVAPLPYIDIPGWSGHLNIYRLEKSN